MTIFCCLSLQQLASHHPWAAVYVVCVALLGVLVEWRAVLLCHALPNTTPLRDKVLTLVSSSLVMSVVVILLTGFITSWLPLLGPPLSTQILWCHMIAMPLAVILYSYAAWPPPLVEVRLRSSGSNNSSSRQRALQQALRSGQQQQQQPQSPAQLVQGAADGTAAQIQAGQPATQPPQPATAAAGQQQPAQTGAAATAAAPAGAPQPGGGQAHHAGGTPATTEGRPMSAAAAALAAIHWPPPLDVPSWLEEESDVPDAFR